MARAVMLGGMLRFLAAGVSNRFGEFRPLKMRDVGDERPRRRSPVHSCPDPRVKRACCRSVTQCFRRRRGRCRRKGYNHRRRLARNWLVDCILSCLDGTWPKATTTHAVPSIFLAEDGGQGENAQDTNAQNTKEGP